MKNAKAHQIIIEKSGVNLANDDNRVMCDKNETNRPHIENDNKINHNNESVTELNAHSVIIDKLSDISIKDSNVTDKHATDFCPTDTLDLSWLWADNIDRDEDRYGSRLIDQISPIVLSDVNVKVSKPETVTVCMVNQPINCIVDSGAEITVVRQSKLPNIFFQNINNDYQTITLKAAFGNKVVAKLINIPCYINSGPVSDGMTVATNLLCAVTDKLNDDVNCLLTKDDYNQLMNDVEIKAFAVLVKDQRYDDEHVQTDGDEKEEMVLRNYSHNMHELLHADISLNKLIECATGQNCNLYVRDYDKLLFRHENVGGLEVHQVILPICKCQEALHLAHTLWVGHLGSRKCTQRLRLSFWWPNMTIDVKIYCGTCAQCQLRARKTVYDNTPIKVVIRPFNT